MAAVAAAAVPGAGPTETGITAADGRVGNAADDRYAEQRQSVTIAGELMECEEAAAAGGLLATGDAVQHTGREGAKRGSPARAGPEDAEGARRPTGVDHPTPAGDTRAWNARWTPRRGGLPPPGWGGRSAPVEGTQARRAC